MYTERFSECTCPLAAQFADSFAAGNHDTSYVSLQSYHRAVALINVGDMATNATLDALLYQATDTSGTSAKVISGKSITQLTQAGGDGDALYCIEVQTEELDVDGSFDCIMLRVTVGTAAVEFGAWVFGLEPRYKPTATSGWGEIVT